MPTITLTSSNTALRGFDMRFWDVGNISNLVRSSFGANNATQLYYGNPLAPELYVFGTFGNFNTDGDPTTGTATSFTYTHAFQSVLQTISMSGLSLPVPTLFNWISTGADLSFHNALFNSDDIITGSAGNDFIIGYGGSDTVNAGDGDDEIYGEVDPTSVYNPAPGNDTLNGGNGADTINGGAGNDIMNGGDGNDTIVAASGVDTIDGGDGVDTLVFDRSTLTSALSVNLNSLLAAGVFYDGTTFHNVENFAITTGSGADTFTFTGGLAGGFTLNAGSGADHLIVDFSAQSTAIVVTSNLINTGVGSISFFGFDQFTATGGSGNDSIIGDVSNDTLSGGAGNDSLYAGYGVDVVSGGDGDDYVDGGEGSDTVNAGAGNDTIFFNTGGADQIDGGDGVDTITLNLSSFSTGVILSPSTMSSSTGLTLSNGALIRNVERLGNSILTDFNDTMSINGLELSGTAYWGGGGFDIFSADFSSFSSSIEFLRTPPHASWFLTGTAPNTTINIREFEQLLITGGTGSDRLDGSVGNDTLNGGGGNDTLQAFGGVNVMNGGDGDDLIISGASQFDGGPPPTDTIDGGAGIDTLRMDLTSFSQAFTFDTSLLASANGQTLVNGALVRNTERFQVIGGSGDDTFLISGALIGTLQNPSYFNGGAGTDTAIADFSALNTSVTLSGSTLSTSSGSFGVFVEIFNVTGGSAADTLIGDVGGDSLSGGGGNDTLNGGAGADQMYGGLGDDTYVVDNNLDFLSENVGAGIDTVQSSLTRQLGANFENLVLTGSSAINGLGNSLNNVITGNSAVNWLYGYDGADTLDGGGDADKMFGGLGDDTYVVDNNFDFLVENASEGTDTVVSSLTRQLGANFENLTLSGWSLINGLGNSLNNVVTGNGTVNWLYGYDGNDTLDGGGDADKLFGGTGDDTYYVDNNLDFIVENASEGTDTVVSTLTRQLVANFENLVLAGSSAINGLGNLANNTITGNSAVNWLYGYDGNDILDGGGDADKMFGGTGDDIYFVDNNLDFIVENASEGTDSVISTLTRQLTANFENLVLAGSNAINGLGNSADNVITGNSNVNWLYGYDGNDTLDGGGDADKMFGGAGNDTYIIDNNLDFISENVGEGIDTVRSSLTRGLGANFENLVLTGSNAINGFGNTLDNRITGNVAANTLIGDAGADTFVFATALGTIDTITDFNVADDTIELSTAIFTGIGFGALAANAFVIGSAATDADDRIIYNAATGALYYDADGDGAGAAIQIATLATGLALTENDFFGGP